MPTTSLVYLYVLKPKARIFKTSIHFQTYTLVGSVGVELAVNVPFNEAGLPAILLPQEHNLQVDLTRHSLIAG